MTSILSSTLAKIVEDFISFVPNVIGAICVFFIGYVLSKLTYSVVFKLLSKTGIDSIGQKLQEIDLVQKTNMTIKPSIFIAKVLYYMIILVFTVAATQVLAIEQVTQLLSDLVRMVPHILVAIIVLIIGLLFGEALKNIVHTTCKSLGIPAAKIIAQFVFFFVLINSLLIALKKASVPTEFLTDNLSIILAGIVFAFSIGYGLASKDMMSNFLSSFYSKNKVKKGDFLIIEDVQGVVVEIDNVSVQLLTKDEDHLIHIPLRKLSTEKFIIKKQNPS